MAWPVDPRRATLNEHVGAGFGAEGTWGSITRRVPHTGRDFGGSGPIFSVYGGRVVWSGFDREGGWCDILDEADGKFRGYGHAASDGALLGADVRRGGQLSIIGATGTGARGAHLHMWEAVTFAAALRVVTGSYPSRTTDVATWGRSVGLVDPEDAIRRSIAEEASGSWSTSTGGASGDAGSTGGLLMALSDHQQQQIYDALVAKEGYYYPMAIINDQRASMKTLAAAIASIAQGNIGFPGAPYNALVAIVNTIREQKGQPPVDVDEKALAASLAPALAPLISDNLGTLSNATVDALAKRILDEQAKRLAA